jgi:hypothetical protein
MPFILCMGCATDDVLSGSVPTSSCRAPAFSPFSRSTPQYGGMPVARISLVECIASLQQYRTTRCDSTRRRDLLLAVHLTVHLIVQLIVQLIVHSTVVAPGIFA